MLTIGLHGMTHDTGWQDKRSTNPSGYDPVGGYAVQFHGGSKENVVSKNLMTWRTAITRLITIYISGEGVVLSTLQASRSRHGRGPASVPHHYLLAPSMRTFRYSLAHPH
jgi:hypothetical protein